MNKNTKGFGCLLIVISFFVAIAVGFSKLNNDRVSGELKKRIVKRIKIR
ncbi:MAG: hypothetical protein ACMG57_01515 [Candidatus Dojkabacteria bacterium]